MARRARLSLDGLPHLVVQAAVHGAGLFGDEADRARFLSILREAAAAESVAVHGYALAPGRFALLATPERAQGLARAMQSIGRRYVRHYNDRHGRRGPLFEGRFRCALVDPDAMVLACLRYVETLDIDAIETRAPEAGAWSSYRHHAGYGHDPLVEDRAPYWELGNTPFERHAAWRERAAEGVSADERAAIEQALRGGWALGAAAFVDSVAAASRRRARPGQPGRPQGARANKASVDVSAKVSNR